MRPRNSPFQTVGIARVRRSVFNLSYDYKTTCNIGELIPVMHKECIPGDYFTVGNEMAIRLQPMMAPVFHELNAYIHYFFVPHRLLWDKWEDFITRGKDGNFSATIPVYFGSQSDPVGSGNKYAKATGTQPKSLWDYLGYPLLDQSTINGVDIFNNPLLPRGFRQRAYNLIWYEYYRDQNLTLEWIPGRDTTADYRLMNNFFDNPDNNPNWRTMRTAVDVPIGSFIRTRCWEKDYFTSALPRQQRGNPVALPVRGTSKAEFFGNMIGGVIGPVNPYPPAYLNNGSPPSNFGLFYDNPTSIDIQNVNNNFRERLNSNSVNLSNAVSFDISELRLAFQIQRWMERNMRAGVRLKEFLLSHYGVSPRDDRLQRPEYLGGTKQPIIISEVLQTSSTNTTSPQGHMTGHGISVSGKRAFKYHVKEHGTIMGILSIVPRTAYYQGIERTEIPTNVYDYFFPEFQNLSEQEVKTGEVYLSQQTLNNPDLIFGFQGRYNEHRYSTSKITGEFRNNLNYWHFGRRFSSIPVLNNHFVEIENNSTPFLVKNYNQCLVQVFNQIRAVRPMVRNATPGLVDH